MSVIHARPPGRVFQTTTPSRCILYQLPFEVRERIFEFGVRLADEEKRYSFDDFEIDCKTRIKVNDAVLNSSNLSKRHMTPQMIVALRGDPKLYLEALSVYYKINEFCLTRANAHLNRSLSCTTVAKILKLYIRCDHDAIFHRYFFDPIEIHFPHNIVFPVPPVVFPPGLCELTLELQRCNYSIHAWGAFLQFAMPALRKLRKVVLMHPMWNEWWPEHYIFNYIICGMSRDLGVPVGLERVIPYERDEWIDGSGQKELESWAWMTKDKLFSFEEQNAIRMKRHVAEYEHWKIGMWWNTGARWM